MRALAPWTVLLALVAACNKSTEAPPPPLPGQIAFVSDRGRFGQIDIFVMTANGGAMMDLTDVLSKDEWPAWSKDGSKLAFQSDRSANAMVALDIFVSDADGMNVVQLTSDTAQDGEPSWSPDGTQIAFVSNRDSLFHIYVMNAADGSGVTRLTSGLQTDAQPVWSPDGSKIAFATNRDVNDEIYVMDADGSSPVNLTKNGAYDDAPAWSPDGTKIAFMSSRTGGAVQIFVMNADGTNVARPPHLGHQGGRVAGMADHERQRHRRLSALASLTRVRDRSDPSGSR